MKYLLLCLICLITISASAQVDTVRLRDRTTHTVVTDRPPQAVYLQTFGSSPIFAAMYDRRFSKKPDGAGFAIGLGYFGDLDDRIFSIPMSLNYLIGRQNHFLELSAGTTFLSADVSDFISTEPQNASGFLHHAFVGYRKQPTTGGFFLRTGVGPIFANGGGIFWFYVGLGYNF